ncbi:hypothetical protein [Mucilaginibacter aquariorum]|uniref:Uncharacterized protein n=1 Tax=Mucilaginibacter aquariorum TaxID=2967225 RepID=A0ABT1SZ10_9SPHI|nr:hypothetical protein [Mucilaginibacter aquariorum]MCQ6957596.1 hypothetical protein [Mucilaginibacter aquariorum]
MEHQTITAGFITTICWTDNTIVDWASGYQYELNGHTNQMGLHYGFGDSAINSGNGEYVFIYKKLGTKGLLLKNGELVREINRSYYCSDVYEFPAAFATIDGKTYLIHCPIAYNQIDFEDVETGELITNVNGREPDDMFYSRLEVSPDGTYLMSKGWVWHPLDRVVVFNIKECINNPKMLDAPQLCPDTGAVEVCTAGFIDDNTVVIGSSDEFVDEEDIGQLPPGHICLWHLKSNQISKPVKVNGDFGNLFPINNNYVWDLYCFPKIIDINTGEILDQNKEINSGKQKSPIINNTDNFSSIIFNRQTKQIAIKSYEKIEVLTPDRI